MRFLRHPLFVDQGKDGRLDRRQPRMEAHDRPGLAAELVFGVGLAQNGQRETIRPGRRLDHVRDELVFLDFLLRRILLEPFLERVRSSVGLVALPGIFIEVAHVLAAVLLMLRQVIGSAVRDSFQFLRLFCKWE